MAQAPAGRDQAAQPPAGRVIAIFQPHLFSRTRIFAAEFGAALGLADEAVVLDVYAAREDPEPGVTGRLVADAVPGGRAMTDAAPGPGPGPGTTTDTAPVAPPPAGRARRRIPWRTRFFALAAVA